MCGFSHDEFPGRYAGQNLFCNQILHKTHISVTPKGTKAAAASMAEVMVGCCPRENKKVYLDRPFVYMILDTDIGIPIFIGTVRGTVNMSEFNE